MNTRNYGMDLLRCLSIAFVVLAHLYLIYPPGGKMQALSMVFSLLDGVTIFFVLSGFLVGYRLFSCFESAGNVNNARLRRFFISRWFKTLPSYYTMLVLLYFLNYTYVQESGVQTSEYLIFIQNFNKNHPKFFLEAWSLSTEEWFYLATPALLLLLIRGLRIRPKFAFLYVSLLFWIGAHITRSYYLYNASFATMEDFGLILRNRVYAEWTRRRSAYSLPGYMCTGHPFFSNKTANAPCCYGY
ncbi:acyltransferase family protein [Niabella aquatica]